MSFVYEGSTLRGQKGDDAVNGGEGSDLLWGGKGDDTLVGGARDDYREGGFGAVLSDAGVTVNLATNTAAGGQAEGDTIAGFEWLGGSDYADVLTAASGGQPVVGLRRR